MEKMSQIYKKVAADQGLQSRVAEILKDEERLGTDEAGQKMIEFAKELGYEITLDEFKAFFNNLIQSDRALSQEELDAVAGGKRQHNGDRNSTTECRTDGKSYHGCRW